MTDRTCSKCGEAKPIAYFFKHKPNAWRRECRECTNNRRKLHEQENTERPFRHAPLDMAVLFKSGQNCWCCRRTTLPGKMLCRTCSTALPVDNRKKKDPVFRV